MDLAGLDAETAADRLGELIDATAAEFTAVGGTVEASRGDTVTAVFGAPLSHEDHAERAVHAAFGDPSSGHQGRARSVDPLQPWPWGASWQHGQLVTQDQDLDVLSRVGTSAQHHSAQQLGERPIDQHQRYR
jgi:hypothetical protein